MTDPAITSAANPFEQLHEQAEYQAHPQYAPPPAPLSGEPTQRAGEDLGAPHGQAERGLRQRRTELLSLPAVVLIIAVAALFITTVLLILFSSSSDSVNALAVVAVAVVALTGSYFGVSIATQQLREERAEKAIALARVAEAETSVRESDAWAGQMEAGLRVAMVKLQAAGISSDDVVKAAGAPDDFF